MKRFFLVFLVFVFSLALMGNESVTLSNADQLEFETVLTQREVIWDLEFSPDGTLFFSERPGRISMLKDGQLTQIAGPETFANLRVEGEAGLMGIALHPEFPELPDIYVCYSYFEGEDRANRTARYTLENNQLINQRNLVSQIPGSPGHNGCRLAFGPDEKLYIATGDAFRETDAQNINTLNGKILRVNQNGTIPEDNPFGNEVWSLGHRNVQGLAFDAQGRLYATEHGPENNDELNLILKGQNYGWPEVRGKTSNERFTGALESYTPTEAIAIAGLDVYQGDLFPWQNNLLFVSLKTGRLYRVILNDNGSVAESQILLDRHQNSNFGRLRDVAVSPDGYVYIATSNMNDRNNKPHPEDDRIIRVRLIN
jgi:glucose/arabinose dehydrogenase